MSEKNQIIQKMLEMQKQFIAKEQRDGVDSEDYYLPEEGDDLENYQSQYKALANKLIDMAHAERCSKR